MIDYVFDNEDESYHEEIFSSVVKNSEIPAILAKHGYNYEDILLDDSKWTLLEGQRPNYVQIEWIIRYEICIHTDIFL